MRAVGLEQHFTYRKSITHLVLLFVGRDAHNSPEESAHKTNMKGGFLLASMAAQTQAALNSRDSISAAVIAEFGESAHTTFSQHGCWAARLNTENLMVGGSNRVDEVDDIWTYGLKIQV